jgi:flagellar basal body-associated protein FliL
MNKKMLIALIVIAIIIISFGVYAILPYFTNTVVDEPFPTASGMAMETDPINNNFIDNR